MSTYAERLERDGFAIDFDKPTRLCVPAQCVNTKTGEKGPPGWYIVPGWPVEFAGAPHARTFVHKGITLAEEWTLAEASTGFMIMTDECLPGELVGLFRKSHPNRFDPAVWANAVEKAVERLREFPPKPVLE